MKIKVRNYEIRNNEIRHLWKLLYLTKNQQTAMLLTYTEESLKWIKYKIDAQLSVSTNIVLSKFVAFGYNK